ncbi:MAG: DUF2752 domain-containing protein [Gemmatales bacterium]|nr:DUF2752 domain-containing protein [Gemmatales bacterium]MCS7160188.1 DUF2752 domain-containing protein [Gemmatales bacterium]MDW8175388.1 DUF2752 domain-containing protein [Gemmatales bacterium]MDW8222702.1 DUF2752 domain-containing protein [Gemmatales bacterium]
MEHAEHKNLSEEAVPAQPTLESGNAVPLSTAPLPAVIPTVELAELDYRLTGLERLGLALVAGGLVMVLVVAHRLNPYQADGHPRRYGTHEQLGLPPCSFHQVTGLPCPSCGLTTSFSLCVHGDWRAAAHANPVGPILVLATTGGAIWFLAAAATGRRLRLPAWHWLSTLVAWSVVFLVLGSWLVRLLSNFHGER